MAILSNFNWKSELGPSGAVRYRLSTKEELTQGLRLILSPDHRPADDARVMDFLSFAMGRGIDLNAMWVAEQEGRILWAILPVLSPGRTMLLLSPTSPPAGGQESLARKLIEVVLEHYRGHNVDLGQVLLDPQEKSARRIYIACGFEQLAELVYLQKSIRGVLPLPPTPAGMNLIHYSGLTHPIFSQGILASYQQSLDCPALNGLRDIEDVIAGHKATGEHNPALWFALMENDAPLGVLLLSPTPRSDSLELVYLGLAPPARGRGLGDFMIKFALAMSAQQNIARLSLAVDSRNSPAIKLYYRHGLSRICSRIALMRDMRRKPEAGSR